MEFTTTDGGETPPSQIRKRESRKRRSAVGRRLDQGWRAAKWRLLTWLYRHEIAAVKSALETAPFPAIVAAYPDIPLKPVRSYLVNRLKRGWRADAVIGHYRAAARILTDEAVLESHTTGVRLLALSTKAGEVTVELGGQKGLYRESEWRMTLCVDGRDVLYMGLAVVDRRLLQLEGTGEVLFIGVLKTSFAGEHGLDDSRALTKAMEGLRPKALLLLVAQALAGSFGLTGVVGVSNRGHVFAGDIALRRRIKADYDSFWIESGGERAGKTMFALPLTKTQRDPGEYKPNKRAQIRRRHLLEDEIESRVRESAARLLRRN